MKKGHRYYRILGEGRVEAFVLYKNKTFIRLPREWAEKEIYITFFDKTEIKKTVHYHGGSYCEVTVPAVYVNQTVLCQLAENYE